VFERFTSDARKIVVAAYEKADARGDKKIRPAHLLFGLVTTDGLAARVLAGLGVVPADAEAALGPAADGPAPGTAHPDDGEALKAIGIDLDEIRRKAEENFGEGALDRDLITRKGPLAWSSKRKPFTGESKMALELSLREMRALRSSNLGTEHLLLGLLRLGKGNRYGDFTPATLAALHLDPDAVRERVLAELANR
jgi:ATP-dependent Clp protease ATP-binding subunit ClpA